MIVLACPRLLTLAAAVAAVAACGTEELSNDPRLYDNVIFATPFSGSFAQKAEEHKNAILMALDRFEQAGGSPDRPIRLVFSDTSAASGDTAAINAALQATFDSLTVGGTTHVAAIITSSTSVQLPAIHFALTYDVPHIEVSSGSGFDEASAEDKAALSSTMPDGSAGDDGFFATRPLCLPEPAFSADFVYGNQSSPGWTRVAIIHGGGKHDLMHANTFRAKMAEHVTGFTTVADIDLKVTGKTSAEAIAEAKAANAEVIYFHFNGDSNNIDFFKAARDAAYAGKLVTCGMARIQDVLRVGDPDVAPYLAENGRLYFQMRGVLPSTGLDRFQDDLRAYTEKGGEVDTFSASAYDAAMLVALGQQYADATGKDLKTAILEVGVGANTNQRVVTAHQVDADVINRLKAGEDINYDGASSLLEFEKTAPVNPSGHTHFGYQTKGRYYVEQIRAIDAVTFEYRALPQPSVEM